MDIGLSDGLSEVTFASAHSTTRPYLPSNGIEGPVQPAPATEFGPQTGICGWKASKRPEMNDAIDTPEREH
jgi:hypothetical protein